MSSSNITSIYIPRMCVNTTEEEIAKLFYDRRIGFVKRVDFIPIDKKPGFRENLDNIVKACFIHLQSWVRLPTKILENIENIMKRRVRVYKSGGEQGGYLNPTAQFLQRAQAEKLPHRL